MSEQNALYKAFVAENGTQCTSVMTRPIVINVKYINLNKSTVGNKVTTYRLTTARCTGEPTR